MLFLLVLALATLGAAATLGLPRRYAHREAARYGMAFAMAVAGITHWVNPTPFVQHLPTAVPLREGIVLWTGGIEVALGAALLVRPPWRARAGIALAMYLVAVFPGNLYVAVADVDVDGQPGGAYVWLRLPLQLLFIAWAVWSTRKYDDGVRHLRLQAPNGTRGRRPRTSTHRGAMTPVTRGPRQ